MSWYSFPCPWVLRRRCNQPGTPTSCGRSRARIEGVLDQYLRPRLGKKLLNEIRRDDIKSLINQLLGLELSRNTIRNALCVVRGLFNYAIEEGLIESNPAARLGRFTRLAKTSETKGIALTGKEVQQFLEAAKEICPYYYPLFLTAVRTGLRRGELVALQWGDVQLGGDEIDSDRFILVQHNYVRREYTTRKSKKSRRVDLSRELRRFARRASRETSVGSLP